MTTLTISRPIPQDLHAEQCVLGAIMLDPQLIATVSTMLTPDDFYLDKHRVIFEAILDTQHPDMVAVSSVLRRQRINIGGNDVSHLDFVGGYSYLGTLTTSIPGVINGIEYAHNVRVTALRRRLIETGGHITAMAYDESVDLTETMTAVEERLHSITRHSSMGTGRIGRRVSDLLQVQFPERRWIVDGLLPEGLTLCAGAPKTGKSFLWLALCVAAANGGVFLGDIPVRQSNVLYLSLEDGERRLQERLRAMRISRVSDRFEYDIECRRVDAGALSQIEAWLDGRDNQSLVVIDTLAMIKPLKESMRSVYDADYRGVMGLRELAQRHHAAIVLVHHTRKQGADEVFDMISGSQGLMGAVESEMVMRRRNRIIELSLTGKDIERQDIAIEFDRQSMTWTRIAQDSHSQILMALESGLNTIAEISSETGASYSAVTQALKRLRDDGVVESERNGRGTVYKLQ